MTKIETDICVIGAGSGGLSVAAGAVQMGAKVVLIEAGEMGGDCLNTGCVPSKALLHASAEGLDWDAAHAHVRATIERIAPHDSVERFEGLGVRVLKGFAQFTAPREVMVGEVRVRARRFVVATGSQPFVPDIPGLAALPYLTNETIFDLPERPAHLLVVGGGAIGIEMAQAHCRLGCEVTVIEAQKALGREDPDAVALVLKALEGEGVSIHQNTSVSAARAHADGIALDTSAGEITGSHLLVATGRRPSIEAMGLEKAGVETGPGGIVTDARLRTSNRRIFAVGDVTGGAQFTHVAGYQAGLVVRSALFGLPARARSDHIPRAIYTTPELAQVGLTETDARATHGAAVEILKVELTANDRAAATGLDTGFLKVMVARGRPVGATLVGEDAGEQIAFWALALASRLKMSAIAGTVLPYPTVAELSKRAAGAYFSPRLFGNLWVKRVVRAVQRFVP
ncbi:MAG TPA: dihydrolipoamide dehydrogenase [Rhodobacteraceae bacterium]|nr:dihydrolipoamide dehydrogenase [Paracoccaceae bacterium]